jgi:regulator of CtrA degradation
MESRSAHLDTANPAAALVDPIYAEALKLADAARGYFDGPGIAERDALPVAARTATALESLRITTRLIAVVSWGLLQQAMRNGEVAAHADRRLPAPDADTALDLLPARARGLAVASRDLFARAHATDSALAA